MRKLSYNNGVTFCSVDEMLCRRDWDTIVSFMEDDAREEVHRKFAPCSAESFLRHYLEIAPYDLIVG